MAPALLSRIIGTLIRTLLAPVFALLTAKGYITDSDSAQLIIEISTFVVTVTWGFWSKYKDWIQTHLALKMPAGTTPEQLKAEAKSISVLKGINGDTE